MHYPPPIHGAAMVGEYIRDSELINKSFECKYINLSTSLAVDDIGKVGIDKWIRYVSILYNTVKNIIVQRPSLVYITITASGIGFYKDVVVVFIAKMLRRKVVYHFHNKGVRKRQNKWLDNLLYKFAFNNVEVILLSKQLYTDVSKYVKNEKVHYCPNGIPKIEESNLYSENKVNSNTVFLLFLSNLLVAKGINTLLDACKILKEKSLNFNCTIIGGEGDVTIESLNDKIKSLGIHDIVKYKGKKYGAEKYKEYSKADIFVFPSHDETFGLVNLEAMQFSLPVISTTEGGIPDIILDNITGLLIPKKDSNILAKKIETLINDSNLRTQMGSNGKKRYMEKFTLEVFESNFFKIINKIS